MKQYRKIKGQKIIPMIKGVYFACNYIETNSNHMTKNVSER